MKKILAAIASILSCSFLFGQEPKVAVTQIDSLSEFVQYYLRETTSKHFEDPQVPRFLIKDRQEKFVFGVGGSIVGKVYYDAQGSKGIGFSFTREDSEQTADNNLIDLTMNSTKLVFKLLGDTKAGVIDALINVDFFGGNGGGGLRLMDAYINLFGIRIGKTNTAFRDDESLNMVDYYAILSGSNRKIPQVAYSYKFKSGVRLQGGVEFPQATSIWTRNVQGACSIHTLNTLLPDLTANVYYTGERIHLYGGMIGRIINYYEDTYTFKGIPSYAFQFGMNWSFVKDPVQTHKLFAQALWTHGMADCCGGMRSQGMSAIFNLQNCSYIVPDVYGGHLGYQAKFGKNTIDLMASAIRAKGQQAANIPTMYDWGCSCGVNYFRKIITYGTVGAEFVTGKRFDMDGVSYSNNRIYLYLRYDF